MALERIITKGMGSLEQFSRLRMLAPYLYFFLMLA